MNKERFLVFQNSIDKDLLEEAQNYHREKVSWQRYAALAACFCAVIAGVLAWHPWRTGYKTAAVMATGAAATEESIAEYGMMYDTFSATDTAVGGAAYEAAAETEEMPLPMPEPAAAPAEAAADEAETDAAMRKDPAVPYGAQDSDAGPMSFGAAAPDAEENAPASFAMPNPVTVCTLEELAEMGYAIVLPEGAEPGSVARIGEMAEVKFLYGGCSYLLRALKTAESENISGIYDTVRKELDWSDGTTEYRIHEGSEGIVFSWYSAEDGVQWCLWSRDCGPETLMKTAGEIRGAEIPLPAEDREENK